MPKYFNTTDGPIYLEDGSIVGGGEWVDIPRRTRLVNELVDDGVLYQERVAPVVKGAKGTKNSEGE